MEMSEITDYDMKTEIVLKTDSVNPFFSTILAYPCFLGL